MKKIIMLGIILAMVLASLGGCVIIPYDGGGYYGHGGYRGRGDYYGPGGYRGDYYGYRR
jgi:hypothetical protein